MSYQVMAALQWLTLRPELRTVQLLTKPLSQVMTEFMQASSHDARWWRQTWSDFDNNDSQFWLFTRESAALFWEVHAPYNEIYTAMYTAAEFISDNLVNVAAIERTVDNFSLG
eukprot:GFYU01010136.1.p2 GENE.GFYU01010136.1~~GFYU01010136.1.p2  ORF type:complete len:113 (-),score=25.24 GFYU01010136.1:25-363(-)